MASQAQSPTSNRNRARGLRAAGVAVILLGVGAALLPAGKSISSDLIGGLLVAALVLGQFQSAELQAGAPVGFFRAEALAD